MASPAVAQGVGNIACLYVYAGKDADIDEAAKDLRNQAPTMLFVCCHDTHDAIHIQDMLWT